MSRVFGTLVVSAVIGGTVSSASAEIILVDQGRTVTAYARAQFLSQTPEEVTEARAAVAFEVFDEDIRAYASVPTAFGDAQSFQYSTAEATILTAVGSVLVDASYGLGDVSSVAHGVSLYDVTFDLAQPATFHVIVNLLNDRGHDAVTIPLVNRFTLEGDGGAPIIVSELVTSGHGSELVDELIDLPAGRYRIMMQAEINFETFDKGGVETYQRADFGMSFEDVTVTCETVNLATDGASAASVDFDDLAQLLAVWGPCFNGPCLNADFNLDAAVNFDDLAQLLAFWGPCP